jgi:hypothetical protein
MKKLETNEIGGIYSQKNPFDNLNTTFGISGQYIEASGFCKPQSFILDCLEKEKQFIINEIGNTVLNPEYIKNTTPIATMDSVQKSKLVITRLKHLVGNKYSDISYLYRFVLDKEPEYEEKAKVNNPIQGSKMISILVDFLYNDIKYHSEIIDQVCEFITHEFTDYINIEELANIFQLDLEYIKSLFNGSYKSSTKNFKLDYPVFVKFISIYITTDVPSCNKYYKNQLNPTRSSELNNSSPLIVDQNYAINKVLEKNLENKIIQEPINQIDGFKISSDNFYKQQIDNLNIILDDSFENEIFKEQIMDSNIEEVKANEDFDLINLNLDQDEEKIPYSTFDQFYGDLNKKPIPISTLPKINSDHSSNRNWKPPSLAKLIQGLSEPKKI